MDILRCVPTSGILRVIQTNSPHILAHDQIETLWEHFCKKEFSYRLREKIESHKKKYGKDSYFPSDTWEKVYNNLATEEFLRLREDTALLASRTMQLNNEKTQKQTTLLADPRMLIKARVKGAPGPRASPARGPRNAVQKAADETRQWAMQRKQAIKVASRPPTKIDVAPKGLQDDLRRSDRLIKAPAKKLRQQRALGDLQSKRHEKAEKPSVTPPSAQSTGNNKPRDINQSTVSSAAAMPTTFKAALPLTPKKPVSVRTGGLFGSSKPGMMRGMPPVETKRVTGNSNGTVTISVSVDWTLPHNKHILETYTPADKAAALSKPATTTTIPTAEYRKRGSSAISSDDSASASGSGTTSTPTSTSATSPSADEGTIRPVAPIKRRKIAPSLFMPHKVVAKPRTQD